MRRRNGLARVSTRREVVADTAPCVPTTRVTSLTARTRANTEPATIRGATEPAASETAPPIARAPPPTTTVRISSVEGCGRRVSRSGCPRNRTRASRATVRISRSRRDRGRLAACRTRRRPVSGLARTPSMPGRSRRRRSTSAASRGARWSAGASQRTRPRTTERAASGNASARGSSTARSVGHGLDSADRAGLQLQCLGFGPRLGGDLADRAVDPHGVPHHRPADLTRVFLAGQSHGSAEREEKQFFQHGHLGPAGARPAGGAEPGVRPSRPGGVVWRLGRGLAWRRRAGRRLLGPGVLDVLHHLGADLPDPPLGPDRAGHGPADDLAPEPLHDEGGGGAQHEGQAAAGESPGLLLLWLFLPALPAHGTVSGRQKESLTGFPRRRGAPPAWEGRDDR